MSETVLGVFGFIVLMTVAIAASRVLARFTAAKFARAMTPIAGVVEGRFSTDSLTHGWLEGTYRGRRVQVTATPGVAMYSTTGKSQRYNAFEVTVLDVPGENDWSLIWGSHTVGQIFSRDESWRWSGENTKLRDRLRESEIVAELERFAGAGVRGFPTLRYNAREKSLTHRDNVSPAIAPTQEHFRKQLDLVLRLAQMVEDTHPAVA
ncbi:MAG TPA: hypothetical protein VF613_25255 [Longimicrobium sp.]|jgi:hypothetical protein